MWYGHGRTGRTGGYGPGVCSYFMLRLGVGVVAIVVALGLIGEVSFSSKVVAIPVR